MKARKLSTKDLLAGFMRRLLEQWRKAEMPTRGDVEQVHVAIPLCHNVYPHSRQKSTRLKALYLRAQAEAYARVLK
ncbi:MAG: hypothetical protein NWF13_04360 [Candidatus Bathyarchaeota archaeon]|nr:hypothetical protein [Candidatus Bathyarchaeota archaeon]